ncbi:MAG TPA: hypothetical protein VJZ00_14910, partial [Thermoanaerobaculia bacterium]|nr:hypothetical protein [Thermoanaerobaculia bacterium]
MKTLRLVLALGVALPTLAAHPPRVPAAQKQRGMSYACGFSRERDVRYGSEASAESLRELKDLGVGWVSITPFGFHRGGGELRWGGERVWETDDSLFAVTKQAHALGIKVLLKPHVWGKPDEAGEAWLDAYTRFIEHYATIARDANVDAFSIGNELKVASKDEKRWRAIIGRVRAIYRGPLTYGANFDEVFDVKFWDALDWIGVSGYFPLVEDATPTRASLVRAWQPILSRLEALSASARKPVLFTEIGYRSADGAAWRQWEIPRNAPANAEAQRIAYEAFFETVWPRPWVAGAYPWKWFSYPHHGSATG